MSSEKKELLNMLNKKIDTVRIIDPSTGSGRAVLFENQAVRGEFVES